MNEQVKQSAAGWQAGWQIRLTTVSGIIVSDVEWGIPIDEARDAIAAQYADGFPNEGRVSIEQKGGCVAHVNLRYVVSVEVVEVKR